MQSKVKIIIGTLILAVACLYLLQFYNLGIPDDENYTINITKRIMDGELPYRDFYLHQTPGVYYIQGAMFKLLGEEIIVSRLITLVFSLLIFILLFFIGRQIMPENYSLIASFSFLFWGISHYNILASPIIGLAFGLLQLLFLLSYIGEKQKLYLFVSGFFAGVTFLMKQNLGAAVFVYAIVIFFFFAIFDSKAWQLKLKMKILISEIFIFSSSFVLGVLPFALYLVLQKDGVDTLLRFISQQQAYTKQTGMAMQHLSYWFSPSYEFKVNWFYGAMFIVLIIGLYFLLSMFCEFIAKVNRAKLLYLSLVGLATGIISILIGFHEPILLFLMENSERVFIYLPYLLIIITLFWLIRKKMLRGVLEPDGKKVVAITLFILFYNYFSFLYAANYIRQILAYPAAYILLGFWIFKFVDWESIWIRQRNIRAYFAGIVFFIFAFTGFWTAYMQFAQKIFMVPITAFNTSLEIPKAKGIRVTSEGKNIIQSVVRYIKTYTNKDDYIFVFPYDSIFYFLTDRRSPTYYDWFMLNNVPSESQPVIIEVLKKKNVRHIILRDYNSERFPSRKLYPLINEYLLNNFFVQASFGNFMILRRKGDDTLSPYAMYYRKVLDEFDAKMDFILNDGFNKGIDSGWKVFQMGASIEIDSKMENNKVLHLYPTAFGQYLHRHIELPPIGQDGVVLGVWAKGREVPGSIRLRISTSKGDFQKVYSLSSTWMFYTLNAALDKTDKGIDVYIYPDDGMNGNSMSEVFVSEVIVADKNISSIEDIFGRSNKWGGDGL